MAKQRRRVVAYTEQIELHPPPEGEDRWTLRFVERGGGSTDFAVAYEHLEMLAAIAAQALADVRNAGQA